MARAIRGAAAAVAAAVGAAFSAAPASAETTTTIANSAAISIPDELGATPGVRPADPYPVPITVPPGLGALRDVKVALNGFSHAGPSDVGVVVESSAGDALLLMNGAWGDTGAAANLRIAFSDAAGDPLPQDGAPAGGDYRPAAQQGGASFPAPGPGTDFTDPGPLGTPNVMRTTFAGTDPAGVWNLWIIDTQPMDGQAGSIAGGWELQVTTSGPAPPAVAIPAPPATASKPPGRTGRRGAALNRCKKLKVKAAKRKRCRSKAKKLPV